MAVISIKRDTNNNVSLVRMQVSDNLSTVAVTDYILNQMPVIMGLNDGVWSWFMTDMLLVAASDGNALFQFIDDSFTSLIIYGEQGSGTVNPGLANQVAYYAANGTNISGLPTAANGVLATSSLGVPSITQFLPSAVQLNITNLGTITVGMWQGTPVTVPYGGTGDSSFTAYAVVCGGTTATGALQSVVGLGSAGDILTSNGAGALPTFQTGIASGIINTGNQNDLPYYSASPSGKTLSAIAGALNSVLITGGTGVPALSQTLPSAVQGNITAVGMIASGIWEGSVIALAYGGTNANLMASAGSVVYSTASAMAFSAVGNSGQLFQSTGTTAPGWTTATYPATASTSGNVLTSDGTNWGSSPPAASASSVIVDDTTTNATMYPTWVTASTGSLPLKVSSTKLSFNPSTGILTTTSLKLSSVITGATAMVSSAGLNTLQLNYVASSVNYVSVSNNTTGNAPYILGTGSDGTVGLNLVTKGGAISIVDIGSATAIPLRWTNAANTHYFGFKSPTTPPDIDFILPSADGSANYPLTTNGSGALAFQILPIAGGGTGVASSDPVIQRLSTQTGAVATGTTVIPTDDTIPQNTEGDQYMSLAITPKNSANILKIDVVFTGTNSATGNLCVALFQDSTANSLACSSENITSAATIHNIKFTYTMTAGTTSATTFKVRAGINNAGTTTFNGSGGARLYGGVYASSITITEYTS